jgi:catechol 2,3-dioxygenase-like lactoylglutathione lyase family enzyme
MHQSLAHIAHIVRDYDEAIAWFTGVLGFTLVDVQAAGARRADDHALTAKGVRCVRPPAEQPYGTVAVFEHLYGNLWDLIGPPAAQSASSSSAQTGASSAAASLRRVSREP